MSFIFLLFKDSSETTPYYTIAGSLTKKPYPTIQKVFIHCAVLIIAYIKKKKSAERTHDYWPSLSRHSRALDY